MISKNEAVKKLKNDNELLRFVEAEIDAAIEKWNGNTIRVEPSRYTKTILGILEEKYIEGGWKVKVSYYTRGEGYGEYDTYYMELS
jgi:hypothetical protein